MKSQSILKGLCRGDFVCVLIKNCAETESKYLFLFMKCPQNTNKKMSSDFKIISFQFFEDTRGLEKVGRYFQVTTHFYLRHL